MRPQVRPTSLEAFRDYKRGKLGKAQREVLEALRVAKPPVRST